MLTSVVIVTANSGAGVRECVARALDSGDTEVIVVDNASIDGCVDALPSAPGRLRVLRNASNLGFGTACNRGAREARGELLLFLNPDCELDATTLAALREALAGDARIGLVGALQVGDDGVVDPASQRRDPLMRRALATLSGLAHWPAFEGVAVRPTVAAGGEVDAVSGALMLLPRDVFEKVGGFDEGYFLHCEDLDLCRRVRDAGWRVTCAAVRVVHHKGGSSRRRPLFVAWHKHRGMWRWFVKFDPAARNPLWRGVVRCGLWGAFALRAPLLLLRGLRAAS